MRGRIKLAVTLFVALCSLSAATASRARQQPSTQPAPALNEQERRGRHIYLRGESAAGREIVAVVGEVEAPASTLTCAGCHGARGEGKTEGGVAAGNLTWSNLVKTGGHTHPSGRRHGPFDEAAFARAVTGGVDPDGNDLLVAMPRYRMTAEDVADLVAYLKRIEAERDPGVTETSVRVGTLAPAQGPLAESGAAMREVVAAFFEEVNSKGGVFNRKIDLRASPAAANAGAQARRLVEQEQVFAFAGGLAAGSERELAAFAAETATPFVGPATLLPTPGTPPDRQIFYLLPGVAEQARSLANFAASRPALKKEAVAVVAPAGELQQAAAEAFAEQTRRAGFGPVTRHALRREGFDAAALVGELKGAGVVLFLGGGPEAAAFIRGAEAARYAPHLLLLGVFMGVDLNAAVTPAFKDKLFVAFPTAPSDVTPEGLAELRALREKYKLGARHMAAQVAALAAARVFVEGLKRAGQDLSRERLLVGLEGLYDFETGLTPRLTFGPNRRLGAAGAHVLAVDPETKAFVTAGGWVAAN